MAAASACFSFSTARVSWSGSMYQLPVKPSTARISQPSASSREMLACTREGIFRVLARMAVWLEEEPCRVTKARIRSRGS